MLLMPLGPIARNDTCTNLLTGGLCWFESSPSGALRGGQPEVYNLVGEEGRREHSIHGPERRVVRCS